MATRTLPTKPERDAKAIMPRKAGPVKTRRAPTAKRVRGKSAKQSVAASAKKAAKTARPVRRGTARGLPDQQAQRERDTSREGYVRISVRVDRGKLSVVGAHFVEGPLAQTTAFQGSHAYEVMLGGRLLHAGAIPDLGVFRSFAHPKGTLEQLRHHTYELSTYDFDVRVPAGDLTRQALRDINVVLYRVKEPVATRGLPTHLLSAAPIGAQHERNLREVGRVTGLPASVLPGSLSRRTARLKAVRSR